MSKYIAKLLLDTTDLVTHTITIEATQEPELTITFRVSRMMTELTNIKEVDCGYIVVDTNLG